MMGTYRPLVIMGVCGSGKTTLGRAVSKKTGCPYFDGDDLHPPSNIRKMEAGIPLDDKDRLPWLAAINALVKRSDAPIVIGCSALKRSYRLQLREGVSHLLFVYLYGSRRALLERLERRRGHYMKGGMLESQLAALEEPDSDEALRLDMDLPLDRKTELAVTCMSGGFP